MANTDFKVKNGLVVGTNATIGGGVETSDLRSKVGASLSIFQYGDDGSGTNAAGIDVNQNSLVFFSKWTDNPNTEIRIEFNDSGNLILPNDTIIKDIGTGPADQAIKIGPTLRISNSTQVDTTTNGAIDGVDRLTLGANNSFTISILNTSQEGYAFYIDSNGLTFPDGTTQSTAWVGINLTTDSVSEGTTNLYYTDSRVETYLSSNSYATTALIDSAINALIDAAPEQLNTLNEIAAALNNDSNFAGTITGLISTKVTEAEVITLIDSAYVQARQVDIYRDSAFVTGIIDGAYINSLVNGVDSAAVTSIIDSAYINTRVNLVSGVDSAAITTLIDSAYIQARQIIGGGTGTVDSAQTIALITDTVDSAYINTRAGIITPNLYIGSSTEYVYIADSDQTVFSGVDQNSKLLAFDSYSLIDVYINGIKILPSDYTSNTTSITLVEPAVIADEVLIRKLNTAETININTSINYSVVGFTDYIFIADSGQTVITGYDKDSNLLNLDSVGFETYINGIRLLPSDYTFNATTLTLVDQLFALDEVAIRTYNLASGGGTGTGTIDSASLTAIIDSAYVSARIGGVNAGLTSFLFIADSGQTTFTGLDANGNTLQYIDSSIQVFLNGISLLPTDYQSTPLGNSLVLNDAAESGSQLLINSYGVIVSGGTATVDSSFITNIIDSAYISSRITIGGTVDSAQTIALITDTVDSAYISSRITIDAAVDSAQIISLITNTVDSAYISAVIDSNYIASRIGTASWIEITDSGSIVAGSKNIIDTSVKPITLTLPASPSLGDEIKIIDGTGNAATNNITINMNGENIEGITDNLLLDVNRSSITLLYYNTAQGWIISEK